LLPTRGATFSAWVKLDGAQKQADVVSLAEQNRELVLGVDGTMPSRVTAAGLLR